MGAVHRVPERLMTDIAPPTPRRRTGDLVRPAVLLLCVAIAGYAATIVLDDPSLPRMLGWFLAAVVLHDGVLLPLYSGADRALVALAPRARVPVVNHVRAPALGAGLTLLLFLPGIIRQGGDVHLGATGLDQQPYLGRWLLLVAAMVAVSALVYGIRVLHSSTPGLPHRQQQVVDQQREPDLGGEPEPGAGQQRARDDEPDHERQPDPLDLGLGQTGQVGEQQPRQGPGGE
jgi:hypothetical protein